GCFRLFETAESRLERLSVDACRFIEPGILDGRRGRDRQQLRAPEVFLGVKARLGMPNGETSQILTGCNQRSGQPRSKLLVALEGVPFFFRLRVRDEDAFLLRQDTMEER